jgi:hypothetical protein
VRINRTVAGQYLSVYFDVLKGRYILERKAEVKEIGADIWRFWYHAWRSYLRAPG